MRLLVELVGSRFVGLLRALVGLLVAGAVPDEMVRIPAGAFVMGSDFGEEDERPAHRVDLGVFLIDRDEVTAGAYARCVAAGRCRPPRRPTVPPEQPAAWVSWEDADAFCRNAGKRLPTEAEWERVARGTDGRRFPWGNQVDCARANFGNYRGEGRCPENPGRPIAVGRYPGGASPEGARDLAGNVWEWVADAYDPRYYAVSSRRDPRGPARGARRVLRGGACCSMFGLPRAANRLSFPPDYVDEDIGFRCAR